MKGLPFVLLFTAMTFLSWGAYGPTLHHGALGLDQDSMRAFVGVGLAYFLIAVLIPVSVLKRNGEQGKWTLVGTIYSFFAGAVGAVGALGIILALAYGGKPVYVMPLVFGFAPVVNTLVTALLSRTFNQISPVFMGGVVATALGAAGVLVFKPVPVKPATDATSVTESHAAHENGIPVRTSTFRFVTYIPQETLPPTAPDSAQQDLSEGETPTAETSASAPAEPPPAESTQAESTQAESGGADEPVVKEPIDSTPEQSAVASETSSATDESTLANEGERKQAAVGGFWGIVFSIVVAALCWGSYGPFLHIGQGKMNGSRLRPFACVGLAYFFIAVAVPLVIIYSRPEDVGSWKFAGMSWSFAAGVLGAIGALGVILAFNAGGKPYYVMPLIFGFAPVINTFIALTETDTWSLASIWFYLSLAVVIGGAVTVLTNAPKPKPKPIPA